MHPELPRPTVLTVLRAYVARAAWGLKETRPRDQADSLECTAYISVSRFVVVRARVFDNVPGALGFIVVCQTTSACKSPRVRVGLLYGYCGDLYSVSRISYHDIPRSADVRRVCDHVTLFNSFPLMSLATSNFLRLPVLRVDWLVAVPVET